MWEFCVCLCFVMHYFVSILVLQSSWRGRESWLLCYYCLTDVLFVWAVTRDFQQCGILTSVDSDQPVQSPFKLRDLKWCLVSSLTVIEYLSDQQRLWSICAYAQADLRLWWSHIPHCWKSHVVAHMSVTLPHGAAGWSAVCDCGISWSYSLTFWPWWMIVSFYIPWVNYTDPGNVHSVLITWVQRKKIVPDLFGYINR